MGWLDRMVRASFRGLEFLTDSHEAKGGRRLVVHEFPGAEAPLVEDMGAEAWNWRLNAYFIGKDYDLVRNGFLAKLSEPGADWLTHPWLGRLWVRARTWQTKETNEQGGIARWWSSSRRVASSLSTRCYLSHYPTIDFPRYFTVIKGKFLTLTAPVE
uniref:DNA circularisation protein N-terminus n=1 Tax=Candidatus Kentrum sp. TUN TaxID=2126343 RepID=A0A451AGP5_9GAMM|nr:MAG: DNA circularisation protein N-terminus [Candidatus Kentron sp. TUN]